MASLLRQIVAGPRAKHQETGLDLCYVTDNIIVTSGPSQTYPQRAYRNPLDRLVAFLDAKHRDNWAIWEFRAEGTGYPDEAVYGRIRHYPWPDHHPPPFCLVPMIMASMRNWLNGQDDQVASGHNSHNSSESHEGKQLMSKNAAKDNAKDRVVVVHCKAGKGRSGTMACSYLISHCGWTPENALAKFTEKRMRPQFGAGVSIPSQLRTISYVDRWTKAGKLYVDRAVEILEVHVWGLRHGVKVNVEGFADEGKKIKVFHTFDKKERHIVQGDAPGGSGLVNFLGDALGQVGDDDGVYENADYNKVVDGSKTNSINDGNNQAPTLGAQSKKSSRTSLLLGNRNVKKLPGDPVPKSKTINPADFAKPSSGTSTPTSAQSTLTMPNLDTSRHTDSPEPGGRAVIFKPSSPICIPNSDINISLERRSRTPAYVGMTMVTAVAHVWFNAFFEGNGPENGGKADDSGVFEIEWDKMDGIRGSSRKGTQAADRISVVWRAVQSASASATPGLVITESGEGSPVPQMRPADWKGNEEEDPDNKRRLGLRAAEPDSGSVSRASSLQSEERGASSSTVDGGGMVPGTTIGGGDKNSSDDDDSLKGVKSQLAPDGEDHTSSVEESRGAGSDQKVDQEGGRTASSEHEKKVEATKGHTKDPDAMASGAAAISQEAGSSISAPRGAEGSGSLVGDSSADLGEEKGNGDTTHLGFVKHGKKVLPMHEVTGGGHDERQRTGEPTVLHGSVKK